MKHTIFKAVALGAFFFFLLTICEGSRPPLEGENTKIDSELSDILAKSKKNEMVPVFILFEKQGTEKEFSSLFGDLPKNKRREKSIAWLKDLSDRTSIDFKKWLKKNRVLKKVKLEKSFWLVNGIQAKGSSRVIQKIGSWPEITKIYLRTEKPPLIVKKDKKWARLNLRGQSREKPFKGPFNVGNKEISWNLRKIRAEQVWDQGYTGRGVVVAILDSGVNYRHKDLRNNIWINEGEIPENGKDDDGNGYVDDYHGWNFAEENQNVGDNFFHGSESAGIIVGDGTSGLITGVSPQATLMILKTYAFDRTKKFGSRYLWQAFQYDKWLAFQYALEHGAQVASLSFDYQPSEKPLFAPWRYLLANATYCGLSISAGSGNSRGWLKVPHQITPPANVPQVVAVGGTEENDNLDRMSSRGPVTWESVDPFNDFPLPKGLVKPDVCAPIGRFPLVSWSSDGYKYHTQAAGTSLSAPHVAGVMALMLEKDPGLMPWEIKARLEETCVDLGLSGKDNYFGWGCVDAYSAVNHGQNPNINLSWVKMDGNERLFVKPGREFKVQVSFRVSASSLERARISLHSFDEDIEINGNEKLFVPEEYIKKGKAFEVDFNAKVSESCSKRKKVFLGLFVSPDRGKKSFFRIPVYIGSSDLLIVNDDGEGENEKFIMEALDKKGKYYNVVDSFRADLDAKMLLGYKSVIWITGEEFENTLSELEQNLLREFFDKGGRLLLLGDNIGDDIGKSEFYRNYLHAKVIKDRLRGNFWREKPYMVNGKEGDPLSEKLAIPVFAYYKQYDLIRPIEGADDPFQGDDEENYLGFIRYSGPYKLIYTSLGMESIEDLDIRAQLLDWIIDWLNK